MKTKDVHFEHTKGAAMNSKVTKHNLKEVATLHDILYVWVKLGFASLTTKYNLNFG